MIPEARAEAQSTQIAPESLTMNGKPLTGQTALVTGASQGIGRAIALALAQGGADVGINYWTHAEAAQEVADQVKTLGQRALLFLVDVANQAGVEDMVARTAAEFGRLDILIANAFYSDEAKFYE